MNPLAASESDEVFEPRLATDGAGTWAAAWATQRPPAEPSTSAVVIARSGDGGVTWTRRIVLDAESSRERSTRDAHVHLAGDANGRWIAVWAFIRESQLVPFEDYEVQHAHGEVLCPAIPVAGCHGETLPSKGRLTIRDGAPDARDGASWGWLRGDATAPGELGNPLATTDYTFCLFDAQDRVLLGARAPAGGICRTRPCWKALDPNRVVYSDPEQTPYGVAKLNVLAGAAGKSKITLSARGEYLSTPALGALAVPLRAQLLTSDGTCWEASYATPLRNDAGQFSAKSN
jgi:hypothetical protein